MRRRELLETLAVGAAVLAAGTGHAVPRGARDGAPGRLVAIEQRHGGRLGVAILDTGSGASAAHRSDEAFLMCSTFKVLLVAAVLARVNRGEETLDRRVVFGRDAVLDYAPVTRRRVGPPGMTVGGLCEAAVTLSDNTATNLLIASVGGPAAVTHYARSLGDTRTRLERVEPGLNAHATTTPRAMLANLRRLLLGEALTVPARERLTRWMLACRTGADSLRAGLPTRWRVGDKTGQWDGAGVGASNDIAMVWPPGRRPLVVTAYYTTTAGGAAARKAVLASVGRIVASI